jgi:hypothetical protein
MFILLRAACGQTQRGQLTGRARLAMLFKSGVILMTATMMEILFFARRSDAGSTQC